MFSTSNKHIETKEGRGERRKSVGRGKEGRAGKTKTMERRQKMRVKTGDREGREDKIRALKKW